MTEQPATTRPPEDASPIPAQAISAADALAADLRVAHVLLRSGNALPARVQLETLAGRSQLDGPGSLDLAESRWRTGDLAGAGEAVTAYLEAGGTMPLAFLIAAEATAANGRPGEARRLARQALEGLTLPLDAVFAGQPRSSIWPLDPAQPVQPAGTLFAAAAVDAAHGGRIGLTASAPMGDPAGRARSGAAPGASVGPAADSRDAAPRADAPHHAPPDVPLLDARPDRSLWDAPAAVKPDVAAELDAAREALASGDGRAAAMRLAIALRMSPALAPAVLDMVGERPGMEFDLLRGDALRLVGHEVAAERAFAAAAETLRAGAVPPDPDPPVTPVHLTRSSE